jgi:glycine betaine/proline transport system ATP-binding protein
MEEPNPLIELIDVNVAPAEAIHPQPIVQHVDWSILPHDFWVIGGLPGTGKTDLLATAAGLQKPLSGTHLLFGRDTNHLAEEELLREKLKIGFVFGTGRLFPTTTVAENVALPICYHQNCSFEQAEPQVMTALKLTGLEQFARSRPRDVTRNLHQRIGLARALALAPEVLMIDNPLLGVDPRLGRWWIDFLCQLFHGTPEGARRMTLVVATDDFRPWKEVGRKFALIHKKKWTPIGTREQLGQYSDPILQELMS